MPKYTLLEMVQKVINDMDSEAVNSIGETEESNQIASIIEDVYFSIISNREIPEHQEMIKLTALSDTDYPTHFQYPTNVNNLIDVWYDQSDDNTFEYGKIIYYEPEEFLKRIDKVGSDYDTVDDRNAGTKLRIRNNEHPSFYTSFDDDYIVFNAYKSTVDTTLQTSKSRALGVKYPTFTISDGFVPDLDANYFPMFLAEAKTTCMSLLVGGPDPVVDRMARRQRAHIQNDKHRTKKDKRLSNYGR